MPRLTSKTMLNQKQNFDHYPICLDIPFNNIISKLPTPAPNNNTSKILNPIPLENINQFCIKFSEKHTTKIQQLTNILQNNHKTNGNNSVRKWTY